MVQAKAKIFLADDRGQNETAWFRSCNTFNFGQYQREHRKPFGNIYVLNDDILDGDRSLAMLVEESSVLMLLPVIGAISFHTSSGGEGLLAAGQVQFLRLDQGDRLEIANPFKDELVNFLQVWIRDTDPEEKISLLSSYDVNEFQNSLVKISPQRLGDGALPFSVSIGKFSGRGETTYHPSHTDAGIFLFVLEGAFEAQGRLLHPRDGLALCDAAAIEVEALSQDAILLLVEQPFTFLVD